MSKPTTSASALRRATWLHFVVLVLSFLCARYELLSRLDSPVFGWRPADGGAIALSYFRNGFHFLFPQVFWGTSGHGYVEMEFPLVPFGTALLFEVFGTHEWVNLIIPFLSGFGLVWLTYDWGKRFFDPFVGLLSAWLVAVTPVLIMLTDTGLWADPPMVLFATLGLYFIARWDREDRMSLLVLGTLFASLDRVWNTKDGLMLSWLGAIVVYIFVAAYGVNGGHYHYLLPFLPVGALTAGLGVRHLLGSLRAQLRRRHAWLTRFAVVLLVLLFAGTAAGVERRFRTRDRAIDSAMWMKKKITGQKLKLLTTPKSLLIVVDTAMDGKTVAQSMTPPDIFYFADRRGWYLSEAWLSVENIEELHRRGASVLVVSGHCVHHFQVRRSDMLAYLSSKYQTLMNGEDGIAFALDRPK